MAANAHQASRILIGNGWLTGVGGWPAVGIAAGLEAGVEATGWVGAVMGAELEALGWVAGPAAAGSGVGAELAGLGEPVSARAWSITV
jgi:hypothetical protein